MDSMALAKQFEAEMIETRRHIHAHPEVSNQEFETTKLIEARLKEYGVEVVDIGMKTGVVGLLKGAKPGRTVAIREDIDALPMPEETGLPFASKNPGVCHSCGHDIHTTVLLYLAKVLPMIKDELAGNVLFLFQPAEEGGGGARQMVEREFYKVSKPDAFIGLHTSPKIPAGTIALKKGPASASSDRIEIKVTGHGGHGAHPENFVDPIAISAYLITQLQTIISRVNNPITPGVLTIGTINGGTAANIVPDTVTMTASLRSLDPNSRDLMQREIDSIVEHCCKAMRGHGETTWIKGTPTLVNDDKVVDDIEAAAKKVIGADKIYWTKNPSMGSEDFSYMFPAYGPGAQFGLGTANDDPNTQIGLHNSKNVFDESCLAVGVAVITQYVRDFLR